MRRVVTVVAAATLAASPAHARAQASGPEVFEPGVISVTGSNIYRGVFAPDGRAFYFFRKVTESEEDYRIFVSRLRDFAWGEPERVELGGEHSDMYPTLSPDGRRLVFTSYRPVPGAGPEADDANLWYADREGDGWGEPVYMAAASVPGDYESGPSFQPDGSLRFKSTTPDWRTTRHLVTRWSGSEYGPPEPDPLYGPWRAWRDGWHVRDVTPHPSGDFVILDISIVDPTTDRLTPTDLYVSFRRREGWTEPAPLRSGVNTPEAYENFVLFSPDGAELFFDRGFAAYHRTPVLAAVGRPPE